MNFTINPDFERLIPPLSQDERAGLEALILADGIQSPLIIARYPSPDGEEILHLADGHNRYRIAEKHGLKYNTITQDFASENDVVIWMVDNQKGRRNLTDFVKLELAEVKAERLRRKGKQTQGKRTDLLSIIDKKLEDTTPHNTRNEIAADLGWSTGKVAMAQKVMNTAPEEIKQKLRTGELSTNQVYNDIKREEKQKEFERRKTEFIASPKDEKSSLVIKCYNGDCVQLMQNTTIAKCSLLLSDPPYGMDFKSGWNDFDKVNNDKIGDTISILDQAFLEAKRHLLPDAHIYIFGNPNEIENIKPLFCKYFNLKNILIWDREVIGMGDLKTYGRSYDVIYFGYNEVWRDLNGIRDRDILRFTRVAPNNLQHPTQKPLDILEYIIRKSTSEGDYILDPFAGSCTTLLAAKNQFRNAYGFELEAKYIPEWML